MFNWSIQPTSPLQLTPSQEDIVKIGIKLLVDFKILVIKGDNGSGKYTAAKELFSRSNAVVEEFNLCELAENTPQELSNQHLVRYFNILLSRLMKRIHNDTLGIIYIRHYSRITDVLTDCNSKLRFLLPLILKQFTESLPNNIRIVITTLGCVLPEGLHWCINLETTRKDMEHVLNYYIKHNIISLDEYNTILKISKIVPVGRIIYCLKYAVSMSRDDNTNILIDSYRTALSRFSGSLIDIDKDVPNPVRDNDLIGVDDILDELVISIINPMMMDIPGISIKKGILLCGPPGTGKTSIGRWLAHKIKGKFYSIGGNAGINGSNFINIFETTIKRANENAPSVVFIDDVDTLFDHDDTYRAFLTILDGIETNKRNGICIILTCMNLRKIPASLLRGGRLEMTIITRLPDNKTINRILTTSLNTMITTLSNYDSELSNVIVKSITDDLVNKISTKMSGWNCADINRCVNDISRRIISTKETNILQMFESCIKQIRSQYKLCGRIDITNLDDNTSSSYMN